MTNHTQRVAEFCSGLDLANVPDDVVSRVQTALIDSVGCGIYGSTLPWSKTLLAGVQAFAGSGDAVVFGTGVTLPPDTAALVNGAFIHSFEFDDLQRDSFIHPGSSVVPPVLSYVNHSDTPVSGHDVLAALVAGYEVEIRARLCRSRAAASGLPQLGGGRAGGRGGGHGPAAEAPAGEGQPGPGRGRDSGRRPDLGPVRRDVQALPPGPGSPVRLLRRAAGGRRVHRHTRCVRPVIRWLPGHDDQRLRPGRADHRPRPPVPGPGESDSRCSRPRPAAIRRSKPACGPTRRPASGPIRSRPCEFTVRRPPPSTVAGRTSRTPSPPRR